MKPGDFTKASILCQLLALGLIETRSESDVVQQALLSYKPSNRNRSPFLHWHIETAHNAIGGTQFLDLLHAGSLAGLIG